jgi:hypothetical protein
VRSVRAGEAGQVLDVRIGADEDTDASVAEHASGAGAGWRETPTVRRSRADRSPRAPLVLGAPRVARQLDAPVLATIHSNTVCPLSLYGRSSTTARNRPNGSRRRARPCRETHASTRRAWPPSVRRCVRIRRAKVVETDSRGREVASSRDE